MARLLWSPPAEPAWARLLARARELAAAPDEVALAASGLPGLLLPRRAGRGLPLAAACAVLDILAVPQPRLAAALCACLAGCAPVLRLAAPSQRQAWLAPLAEGGPVLWLAAPGPGGLAAVPAGDGLVLRGEAEVLAAADQVAGAASAWAIAFAQMPAAKGERSERLRAFAFDAAALQLPAQAGLHLLPVQAQLDGAALLEGEEAPAALAEALALRRLLVAALQLGVSGAAFGCALPAAGMASTEAASRLAACAGSLSGARLLLQEALRAAAMDEDCTLLSAMALLTAAECTERVVNAALQIAGGSPHADAVQLQAVLAARRMHEALAGPAEPQRVLLAEALGPRARQQSTRKASSAMPRSTQSTSASAPPGASRATEPANRVGEILDAAADAFTQQSYDATSLDYIGDVIGVTKGSIYYHYRSKADLFMAVYRRAMEMNIATVEPISQLSGVRAIDRLYRMAYAHALQVMKHLSYQRVAVQGLEAHLMGRVTEEQRERLKEVIALRDRYEDLFVGAIREAIEAGELPKQSARLSVKPLFGAINWTTMWYQPREGETPADRARIATQLATFVVSGLTQSHQNAIAPDALLEGAA